MAAGSRRGGTAGREKGPPASSLEPDVARPRSPRPRKVLRRAHRPQLCWTCRQRCLRVELADRARRSPVRRGAILKWLCRDEQHGRCHDFRLGAAELGITYVVEIPTAHPGWKARQAWGGSRPVERAH